MICQWCDYEGRPIRLKPRIGKRRVKCCRSCGGPAEVNK